MNKLFVQWCAILLLFLMRKLFQTGSPCFPFPLNSKIHNPIQVTVIFGWHSQKFAYPEDKPCIACPEVISGLHQRSNRRATYKVQLTAESTRVFLAGKKGNEVEIARGISLHSVLHLGTPCHHSVLLEPFPLWIFLLRFTFPSKDLSLLGVVGFWEWLLNAYFDLDWPIPVGIFLLWQ